MIDVLKNIEELESIKKLVEDQKPRYLIIEEIEKYIGFKKKEVEAFEEWAEAEAQKDQYLAGEDISSVVDEEHVPEVENPYPGGGTVVQR